MDALNVNYGPTSRLNLELHPMKNPAILDLVFDNCSVKTLKILRLVSCDYHSVSLKSWRRHAVLQVHHNEFDTTSQPYLRINDLNHMLASGEAEKMKMVSKPFHSYKVTMTGGDDSLNYNHINFNELFFNVFAPHTRYLSLDTVSVPYFTYLLQAIFFKFRSLEHLKLRAIELEDPSKDEEIWEYGPPNENLKCWELDFVETIFLPEAFCFCDFITNAPNVKRLTMRNLCCNLWGYAVFEDLLLRIQDSRKDRNQLAWAGLKALDVFETDRLPARKLPSDLIAHLKKIALPLERLSLNLGLETEPKDLKVLLEIYSSTVKFMRLYRDVGMTEENMEPLWKFPVEMEYLEEIRFANGFNWGFHFLRCIHAPNLKKIVFEPIGCWLKENLLHAQRADKMVAERAHILKKILGPLRLEKVEHLEIKPKWCVLSPEVVMVLAAAIPNVKNLKIPMSPQTFTAVCMSWPKLLKMTALVPDQNFEGLNDEVITGFPVGGDDIASRNPNITDMVDLTDFQISSRKGKSRAKARLSEESVTHGFLKLPRLHYLNLPCLKASNDVLRKLREHVPYLHITEN